MMRSLDITESHGAAVTELKGRRYKVRLIEGDRLGSSGYYPASVLAHDGPKVFVKDTPMFLNHQTAQDKVNRPFGAVHEYAGYLAEDAYYENDGLYADVEIFEDVAPMIKARMDKIGISIRAKAVAEDRELNGKMVPFVKQITEAKSADFVMRAGAGGKIVSILESAIEEDTDLSVEENGDNMDEVLAAITALENKFNGRLTSLEESLKAIPVAKVETVEESEAIDPAAKALEIAEAFVASSLDAEGRARVLDLHKANGKPLAELIEAEESYVKTKRAASTDELGVEESAVEVEESAKKSTITVPSISAWGKKK